jgi:hypothetical protein
MALLRWPVECASRRKSGQRASTRGAPGDTDADSVWFAGTADLGGYVGTLFDGDMNGHSPTMYGQLQLRARGTP